MQDQFRSFDMPEKSVAQARSLRGSFDQSRNIRDDECIEIAHVDDAEIRFERCERIIGDLRLGRRR